jgi:4'-phosphopantetheinyl transferase EntD
MALSRDRVPQLTPECLSVPGVLIGYRLIREGDEDALLPEEAPAFAKSVLKRRRASGAARLVARELLAKLGCSKATPLPKSPSGAPVWPEGFVGSWAHDARIAIAAVGRRDDIVALGIDIEPAEKLPVELELIATPRERSRIGSHPLLGQLLFTAKEAVYKALYPLTNVFLEHHDVEIDFDANTASVGGRIVELKFCRSDSLVTLAFIRR